VNDMILNPPAAVRPAEDLAELLAVASAEHEAGQRAERESLEHYRKAGEALIRAKAAAGHGKWLKALKGQGAFSQQRASEYMRLAEGWGKLPPGGSFALKAALRVIKVDELCRKIVAAKAELSASSWQAADAFAELRRRGLGIRRIATACGVGAKQVRAYLRMVRRYPDTDTRPDFWDALDSRQTPPATPGAPASSTGGPS